MLKKLDLNAYLIRNKASTFFLVSGNSMDLANIYDGYTIAVDRSIDTKHGQVVLAVVNDDYTVKRLYRKMAPLSFATKILLLNLSSLLKAKNYKCGAWSSAASGCFSRRRF